MLASDTNPNWLQADKIGCTCHLTIKSRTQLVSSTRFRSFIIFIKDLFLSPPLFISYTGFLYAEGEMATSHARFTTPHLNNHSGRFQSFLMVLETKSQEGVCFSQIQLHGHTETTKARRTAHSDWLGPVSASIQVAICRKRAP